MEIERRRLLKLSTAYSVPLLLGVAYGGAYSKSGRSNDPVIIVGAGMAGLHAADILMKAGLPVILLEARDHPGGRVQTIHAPFDDGLYAEAGPIRIAASHKRVLRLAQSLGLTISPFDSTLGSALYEIGGRRVRSDDFEHMKIPLKLKPEEERMRPGDLLRHYMGSLPADLSEPELSPSAYGRWAAIDRVSWPDWLRSRGASDGAVQLMTLGGDSAELSALYVLRQFALLQSGTFYKIKGGMDSLPRSMESSVRSVVRYNAAVVRIDQTSRQVRVDCVENNQQMNTFLASRVILTTPLTTLRQIEIRPPFSRDKELLIEGLPYFPATRFLLQTRRRFWYDIGLNGYARTDEPSEIWDTTNGVEGTAGILGATIGGALGRSVLTLTDEKSIAFGTDLVAKAFPAVRSEFQKGFAKRWALEPWSRGAFAVFHPGQMVSMMPDLARPEGRVHFAGEHTSSWMGWMEGALESGERAAGEVLRQMN